MIVFRGDKLGLDIEFKHISIKHFIVSHSARDDSNN